MALPTEIDVQNAPLSSLREDALGTLQPAPVEPVASAPSREYGSQGDVGTQYTGQVTLGERPTAEADPYAPRTYQPTAASLPRIQQGLVSMLSEENELRKLAGAKGLRYAQQRGLGASSFGSRAGVGAEMEYVTPIVTQAEQFDVQKDLQAQTLTGRSYSEAQAHLANKYQQDADIAFQTWAKEADLSHLQMLEGNRSAATAGQNYSSQLAGIYADPATTTLQKQEAVRLLSNAFTQNLELIEATSKIDLSKFLPDFVASQQPEVTMQAELESTMQNSGWAVGDPGSGDFDAGGYGVSDTTGSGRTIGDLANDVKGIAEKYGSTFTTASLLGGPAVGAVAVAARAAYDAVTGGSDDTSTSGTSSFDIGAFGPATSGPMAPSGGGGGGGGDRGASRSGLGSPGASRVGGVDRSGYA